MGLSFVFLLLMLLFIGGVIGLIVLMIARARRPKVSQASCGNCLYAVEGLSTMTCPECGSDLRAVGIITPRSSPGAGPQLWAILWTIMLPLPALLISRMVIISWPAQHFNERYARLRPPTDAQPFDAVEIELWSHNAAQPQMFEWVSMELHDDSGSIGDPFTYSLDSKRWRIGDAAEGDLSDGELTSSDVAQWIATTVDNGANEVDHVEMAVALLTHARDAAEVRTVSLGEHFETVNINAVGWTQHPQWLRPVLWLAWLAVWGVGVLVIVNRARRKSKPESQTTSRIIDISSE